MTSNVKIFGDTDTSLSFENPCLTSWKCSYINGAQAEACHIAVQDWKLYHLAFVLGARV